MSVILPLLKCFTLAGPSEGVTALRVGIMLSNFRVGALYQCYITLYACGGRVTKCHFCVVSCNCQTTLLIVFLRDAESLFFVGLRLRLQG